MSWVGILKTKIISNILKYRYRRRYLQYRKIPNTGDNISKVASVFSVFASTCIVIGWPQKQSNITLNFPNVKSPLRCDLSSKILLWPQVFAFWFSLAGEVTSARLTMNWFEPNVHLCCDGNTFSRCYAPILIRQGFVVARYCTRLLLSGLTCTNEASSKITVVSSSGHCAWPTCGSQPHDVVLYFNRT